MSQGSNKCIRRRIPAAHALTFSVPAERPHLETSIPVRALKFNLPLETIVPLDPLAPTLRTNSSRNDTQDSVFSIEKVNTPPRGSSDLSSSRCGGRVAGPERYASKQG